MDEGKSYNLLSNCFERMDISYNIIVEVQVIFMALANKILISYDVTLDVAPMGKVLSVDFLYMGCRYPYNAILGRDWAILWML